MKKQVTSPQKTRQRKFLLALPLLVLPFMTMAFWALGGGKTENTTLRAIEKKGFNINLPDANLKDEKTMDKMSYYNKAQTDSLKFLEMLKNDPNYKNMPPEDTDEYVVEGRDSFQPSRYEKGLNIKLSRFSGGGDSNTDKIYRKLAELDKEINKPVLTEKNNNDAPFYSEEENSKGLPAISTDMGRLEKMMDVMNQPAGADPELNQLDGMLDKILDVQHPERVQEKLKQASEINPGQVFAVSSQNSESGVSVFDTCHVNNSMDNGFYSLSDMETTIANQNAVQAVVHETQVIVDGSIVKLRLTNDVFINGIRIPKDNFLFGVASLQGERLTIKINTVRFNNSLYPVALSVYDMDGLDGIYIPGAISGDVAKQSAAQSVQNMGLTSLDASWQAQAAGAGIEAAKTLFAKKLKLVKVTVKAGYRVLLLDEKQKQSK